MNSQNHISSQIARQILLEAEQNGVSVEIYLKNLADDSEKNGNRNFAVNQSSINYDFAKTRQWLKENAAKYVGKWIVLDGENLVGFGENPVPIVEKARKEGVKIPFVQFIDDNSQPFMGGWL
jgi:Family of unknown function (DUF5678)